MQPVHEMPVVIEIISQLLYDNLLVNNYIFCGLHGCYFRPPLSDYLIKWICSYVSNWE